jgi:NAD(P)-dependent dehydrogenase (short-subunit alcohol dehydrogenase family)
MRKTFTDADQLWFADLSGDRNPMHVSVVSARRTIASDPAVHGIHLLLWALDAYAKSHGAPPRIFGLRAKFSRFVATGEEVNVEATERARGALRLRIIGAGVVRSEINLQLLPTDQTPPATLPRDLPWFDPPAEALSNPAETLAGLHGRLAFATPPDAIAAAFPDAARWIGAARLGALGASTYIVGMVHPGLHSIYAALDLAFVDAGASDTAISFALGEPAHGLIATRISGAGVSGTSEAFVRKPPITQPDMVDLVGRLAPDAFVGSTALIIGGSRGLGELTAKLIATGGGRVLISYRIGEAEALAVAADICDAGGECDILPYDVKADAQAQLARLDVAPTHAYYFAAPTIARPNSRFFDRGRLDDLVDVFAEGFWSLGNALYQRRRDIRLFYPSTTFLDARSKGMAEYAMAKAAGEQLCFEMNMTMAPLTVVLGRLPPLLTDQTAGVVATGSEPSIAALLPLIAETQRAPTR